MKQYLLLDKKGYYWICFFNEKTKKYELNGPHSEKYLNLEEIEVENPITFAKERQEEKPDTDEEGE